MISKKDLHYYSSLLTKKHRKLENKFLVEGKKSIIEGLASKYKCEIIFVTNKFQNENESVINEFHNYKVVTLRQNEFNKVSDTKTPQGIAAVFIKPNLKISTKSLTNEKLIVLLDNISDPGNLGTIIRNCDWFGIKNILLSRDTVDFTNPKVVRSSMGSIFHLNVFENIEANQVNDLKSIGYEILCADTMGEDIFTYRSNKKKMLILSSEAHGPSKEFLEISDKKICIPQIGHAESLNVASASAVLLAELTK